MEFSQAFDLPIIETVGGIEIKFPVLLINDYKDWIGEIVAQRKTVARQKLNAIAASPAVAEKLADPMVRWRLEQDIESLDLGLEVVAEKVWTLEGAQKVLQLSLAKQGYTVEDQQQILARIPGKRLHLLARDVSGLFERIVPETKQQAAPATGNPDPNSGLPATGASAGSNATGSGTAP